MPLPAVAPLPPAIVYALTAAGALAAAIGLAAPELVAVGLGGCALWTAMGCWRFGLAGLAAAVPALALIPGGNWYTLTAWSVVAVVAALALMGARRPADPEKIRELRNELRDAEHERLLLHRHIRRYPVLLEACMELSSSRDLGQLADGLCLRAKELAHDVKEVRVFLGSAGEPTCRASSDAHGRSCARAPGADELYVAAEARPLSRRHGNEVRVLVPLRGDRRREGDKDTLRGVLEVVFIATDVGDRLTLELLHALGRLGGLGLAAVDLLNQARSLALHDELTGLYGQHEFLRRLDEQAASCRRHKQPLGLIMCDMDHLKKFNDTFGHPAGDQALKAVAAAVRAALPTGAIACRYGGEEFAALFPDFDAAALAAVAEKLRAAIAAAVVSPAHPDRKVTASVGGAVMRDDEAALAALKRADAACYAAKAAGRNRVEVAT